MILTPKNWDDFQHYKDRSPIWIKLHRKLLDDFDFHMLPVASKALAPMLWLLASEYTDGIIDATIESLAFRLRILPKEFADALNPLITAKFFSCDSGPLAGCKQVAMPEKRRDREEKRIRSVAKPRPPLNDLFEEFKKIYPRRDGSNPWSPARKLFEAAIKKGATGQEIIDGALVFAAKERANIGTPYIPQAVKWLRNEGWKDQESPAENFKSNDISGYLS